MGGGRKGSGWNGTKLRRVFVALGRPAPVEKTRGATLVWDRQVSEVWIYRSMPKTMFLPGFSHQLAGRRSTAAAGEVRRRADRLDGLATMVGRFVPKEVFSLGEGARERVYTPWVTFVAFLGQVLTRGSACREAVRRVQAWCVAERREVPDENSSGYCQARARLDVAALRAAHEELGAWMERHKQGTWQCMCPPECPRAVA